MTKGKQGTNSEQFALSRRDVLVGASALGLAAGGLGSLSLPARAAEPKKGGTLRYGCAHGSTTDNLDPATYENDFTIGMSFAFMNFLTEIGTDGSLQPELAESWEASADAATWTFKLKKGIQFHNGKEMTAEDVIASFNHHRGEDSNSAAKPIVAPITDITADGNDTVIFTLSGGNADFPFIVSDYHLGIMPSEGGKIDPSKGIGTGPYVIKEFDPGVRALLSKNPNYFKSDRGHFNELLILSIIDPAARTNAMITGEVDVISRPDLKTVHMLKRRPGIKLEQASGTLHYTFPMHVDVAPFNDPNVRLALKYALDREQLVEKILRGYGVVGNDHPIGKSNRFYAADLEQRSFDPDKAKFHLKEAGMSSLNVDLHLADAAFQGAVDAGLLYSEDAAKAGITLNVVREPNDGYWSNVWLVKDFCGCYWGGRPTEDWMFSTAYAKGAPWNDTHWANERFNKLLVEARAELDQDLRRDMYHEMQALCRDDGGTIVPMFSNYVMAMSDKVEFDGMAANWDMDGQKFSERWWFAS
ncbi:MAG: ABC transporter substrate-binding protein [Kiloniellales bacterium]